MLPAQTSPTEKQMRLNLVLVQSEPEIAYSQRIWRPDQIDKYPVEDTLK